MNSVDIDTEYFKPFEYIQNIIIYEEKRKNAFLQLFTRGSMPSLDIKVLFWYASFKWLKLSPSHKNSSVSSNR